MADKKSKRLLLLCLIFVAVWEATYQLGLMDSFPFSHPFKVIQMIWSWTFLKALGHILLAWLVAVVMGTILGVALGICISKSVWWTESLLGISRIGQWMPLLMYWALPVLFVSETTSGIPRYFSTLVVNSVAVGVSVFHQYLSLRYLLRSDWRESTRQILLQAAYYGLLLAFFSQRWSQESLWAMALRAEGVAALYAAVLFFACCLSLINRALRSNFELSANKRRIILLKEVFSEHKHSGYRTLSVFILFLACWQSLSFFGADKIGVLPVSLHDSM